MPAVALDASPARARHLDCPFCQATKRTGCLSCESKVASGSSTIPSSAQPSTPKAPPTPTPLSTSSESGETPAGELAAAQPADAAPDPAAAILKSLNERIQESGETELAECEAKLGQITIFTPDHIAIIHDWIAERRVAIQASLVHPDTATEPRSSSPDSDSLAVTTESASLDIEICGTADAPGKTAVADEQPKSSPLDAAAIALERLCMGPQYTKAVEEADRTTLEAGLRLMLPTASRHLVKIRVLTEHALAAKFCTTDDVDSAMRFWVLTQTDVDDAAFAALLAQASTSEIERALGHVHGDPVRTAALRAAVGPATNAAEPTTTPPAEPSSEPASAPVIHEEQADAAPALVEVVPAALSGTHEDMTVPSMDTGRIPVPLETIEDMERYTDEYRCVLRKKDAERWSVVRRTAKYGAFKYVASGTDPVALWHMGAPETTAEAPAATTTASDA